MQPERLPTFLEPAVRRPLVAVRLVQLGRQFGLAGGATLHAEQAGLSATFQVERGREAAIVGTAGPGCGGFVVYVNDRLVQTVTSANDSVVHRRVLATVPLPFMGTPTIRVVTTSAAPVDLDGLVALQNAE